LGNILDYIADMPDLRKSPWSWLILMFSLTARLKGFNSDNWYFFRPEYVSVIHGLRNTSIKFRACMSVPLKISDYHRKGRRYTDRPPRRWTGRVIGKGQNDGGNVTLSCTLALLITVSSVSTANLTYANPT
jgi:hypothetical protein